ncbi:pectinesterase [Salvia divinorum]|uniref:Pectinesterase n=1 Tax=Salvia divinorum TaxID=28513 RepID=A0ABD1ILX1_SALDI
MLIGDGIDATVVSGDRSVKDGYTTFRSATFAVSGKGFIARGMTFENTAGPHKHQARDFIFGDAVALLQNCNIYVRRPIFNQKNTVTAQGRKDPNENTGIVIQNSVITAAPDLRPVQSSYKSYLGRPWKEYSRTVFSKCVIDGLIDPAGWLPWSGDFGLATVYYGEYMNSGVGGSSRGRVNWTGFHHIRHATEAGIFSARNFLRPEFPRWGLVDSGNRCAVYVWPLTLWLDSEKFQVLLCDVNV